MLTPAVETNIRSLNILTNSSPANICSLSIGELRQELDNASCNASWKSRDELCQVSCELQIIAGGPGAVKSCTLCELHLKKFEARVPKSTL